MTRVRLAQTRIALGLAAVAGCLLSMWFNVFSRAWIYGSLVALFAAWIGLWPFNKERMGSRLLTAGLGSIGVCFVLMLAGEVIARVQNYGQEEFGPILFAPVFMVVMGVPVTLGALLVAAFAPRLLTS